MNKPVLRLLIVEDSEDDAYLLLRLLIQNGYEVVSERVDTADALREALNDRPWDLIISDYKMPNFSGIEALQMVKNSALDLSFIIISGVIGEDVAVAAMRAGAHDYLIKGHLARLIPAIERELHEAAERHAHKRAEQQIQRLSLALDQSASLVMILSAAGSIEYVNPTFSHVTGYGFEELVNTSFNDWQSSKVSIEAFESTSTIVRSGSTWSNEVELTKKNGETYWALMSISPIKDADEQITGILIVQEDITERKHLEMQLQDYLGHLEQTVAERSQELIETNRQLNIEILEREQAQSKLLKAHDNALAALKFKNQILANMNHEIRTPLSIINNTVYLLNKGQYGALTEKQEHALSQITTETQSLLDFMENLLEVANRDNNPVEMEFIWLKPEEFITNVLSRLVPKAEEKGLLLETSIAADFPEKITGNMSRLSRILYNLVDNAIKFTDQGQVSVKLYRFDPCRWAIQVADTGPGINEDVQAQIFEPFWQADGSTTRRMGRGVGLGLSVVRKLVALMNGEIQINRGDQGGTQFTITFPIEY